MALLGPIGVDAVWLEGGVRALQAVEASDFSLALIDADLAGGKGVELCRTLAEQTVRPIPVIVRCDIESHHAWREALEAGALHCVSSTAAAEEIVLLLRNALKLCNGLQSGASAPTDRARLRSAVLDVMPGAVIITDSEFRVVDVNTAVFDLTGLYRQDVSNASLVEIVDRFSLNIDVDWLRYKLQTESSWQGEFHSRPRSGEDRAFWLHVRALGDSAGHHVLCLYDIAHLKHREQRLRALAETDALTGIANRNLFLSRLNEAIDEAESGGEMPSLLFLDLDGFKDVNDHFGHGRGDQVLREVAATLQSAVRAGDLVARHGGDEFVVLLQGASHQALEETAQRIQERLALNIADEDDFTAGVTCSIGLAVYPGDGVDVPTLLKHADKAMYAAKGRGKNGYCFASTLAANT